MNARRGWRTFGNNLRARRLWRNAGRDVREEMTLHVELRSAELIAAGEDPARARARAEREVGPARVVVPRVEALAGRGDRAEAWRQLGEELAQDVRHGVRVLTRSPGYAVVAVLTISLGLAANAGMFAVVHTMLVRPLPFDREGRLVRVREYRTAADGSRSQVDASRRTADAVASRSDLFSSSVALLGTSRALLTDGGARHLQATRVGAGFTRVLGISPILGRPFSADEDLAGDDARAALISHRLWRSALEGAHDAVGRSLLLDGASYEIVGVLPPNFHVPYDADVWLPARFDERQRSLFVVARLADGASFDAVNAELAAVGRRLVETYPDEMRGFGVNAVRLRDFFVGTDDRVPVALMGAVAFLLLIGSANVALLMTTRFAARRREVAVRAALGCGRGRQVRQFVTEAVLLFAAGAAVALLVTAWMKDSLAVLLPEAIAGQVGVVGLPLDFATVAFTTALAGAAGVVFGLVAALRSTGTDLHAALREAGRSLAGDRSRGTLRTLAAGEVALAIALLTAAAMMTEAFYRLQTRDLGFDSDRLLTARAGLEAARFAEPAVRLDLLGRVLDRVSALPGVDRASFTTVNPLCCGNWGIRITPEGAAAANDAQLPVVQHQLVMPGFFETMGIGVLEGRSFTVDDREGREPVVIVDERMARRFWPGTSALGKRVKRGLPSSPHPWLTVVGVVSAIEDDSDYTDTWYLPYPQHATGPSSASLHLMVRTPGDPLAVAGTVRDAVAGVDPGLAWHAISPMDGVRAEELQQNRLGAVVSLALAGAGLLLATLGLYGVVAYVLAGDTRELGIRLALGARPHALLRLVVNRGLRIAAAGIAAGAPAAYFLARGISAVLPDARVDPRIVAAAAVLMLLACTIASLVPGRRALRMDPLDALRLE